MGATKLEQRVKTHSALKSSFLFRRGGQAKMEPTALSGRGIPRLSGRFLSVVTETHLSVDEVWRRALISDLVEVADSVGDPPTGTISTLMSDAHATTLARAAVVQVEDAVNVAHAEQRNEKAARARGRAFKLILTDGAQHFPAFEFRPIPDWSFESLVPGTKLLLKPSGLIRRGQFLLSHRDVAILGTGLPVENPWGAARWKRITQPVARGPGLFSKLAADEESLDSEDMDQEDSGHPTDDFELDADDLAALEADGF